jgi:hypothetical protein
MAVYPAGGQVGTKLKARFISASAGDSEQEFQLPTTPQDKFAVFCPRLFRL